MQRDPADIHSSDSEATATFNRLMWQEGSSEVRRRVVAWWQAEGQSATSGLKEFNFNTLDILFDLAEGTAVMSDVLAGSGEPDAKFEADAFIQMLVAYQTPDVWNRP